MSVHNGRTQSRSFSLHNKAIMAKRPSPDSVICIDLTESDDEREANLSDVRKRLKGTPADTANSSVKLEGATTNNNAANNAQQQWAGEVEIIEPTAPEIHAVAAPAASEESDDVVLVGTANESRLPHMRQHCPDNKFIQDVVFSNRQSHMTATKRTELREAKTGNVSFCDLCFCYVCDKKASECTSWGATGHMGYSSHCHASDTGRDAHVWKNKRNSVKNGGSSTGANGPALAIGLQQGGRSFLGFGPFQPDNAQAAQSNILTQCRYCSWHNRFRHRNYTHAVLPARRYDQSAPVGNPVGHEDWCHSCGRIASERDFGKLQSKAYTPLPGDVFLGTKTIPFKIVAHDPRQMEKYQEKWTSHQASNDPKWNYSEAAMEEDVFKHRFGKHPVMDMILGSIPVVDADKIPKNTSTPTEERETFKVHYTTDFADGENDPDYNPNDYDEDGYRTEYLSEDRVAADETEAIILSNPDDRILLEELKGFGYGVDQKDRATSINKQLRGDIVGKWNSESRSGTFTVRVFIPEAAFSSNNRGSNGSSLHRFLGSWFGFFPFSLKDFCGPIRAEGVQRPELTTWSRTTSIRRQHAFDKMESEMDSQIEIHNGEVKDKCDKLSLNCSAQSALLGGVCSINSSLEGVLKSYFRESFAEDVSRAAPYEATGCWIDRGLGIVSAHRQMRKAAESIDPRKAYHGGRMRTQNNLDACLSENERILAVSNLSSDANEVLDNTRSMKGLLEHLENLHHPSPVPLVEGLNVELLAFQRQSVQWALERETTPGGIQSFLWPKLPSVAEPGEELYYSPILERFRRDKPHLVRGGIIAEEMGLGKTVISLALILQNPAPAVPQSGSPVAVLNDANGAAANVPDGPQTWDKDLYARTSVSNSKRGSIISRGTLVVCHVSLVGQWIDEAKSKLSDPGLVYPYHGQSRKRDAATLAENAIVVTTYQTLASDATYHAKKGGADYCAPCEQVRWWRVICDESHSLREAATKKSQACMSLVADHKWLVSGTPVSTTFNDLKNQLNFIGIENVNELFGVFLRSAFRHAEDPTVPKRLGYGGESRSIGPFVFMMRNIMIRHTQKQTYRGTTTTLMSLPPKTERSVEVDFSDEEKEDYAVLEKAARDFYTGFKESKGHELSKHYLLLSQKLVPLRIAASGGRIPLDDEAEKAPESEEEKSEEDGDDAAAAAAVDEEAAEDSEDETPVPKKKKVKKEQRFSEFAYKSKLDALIAELEIARDDDPNAKSLVFSQFTSTLNFLQQELPKHGFQYRTLSGDMSMKKRAKALHDFQHDPPTTIFLLSMRAGAVGINLTQANRVFLMEPSFNPALEAQAIGRVHRLGQKRNVEIVRFVMKESVEPRILKMLKKKYSDNSSAANEEIIEVGSKKNRRVVMTPALVGSIASDRTAVLGAEFDILFGVDTPETDTSDDDAMEVEPDAAVSSQNGMSSASV